MFDFCDFIYMEVYLFQKLLKQNDLMNYKI